MQGDMDIVDPSIDAYLARLAGSPDPVEAEMRRFADDRDGFPIVGPAAGQFLMQLALTLRAKRIFEVGSGFGYSAFWLARALGPGGTCTLTETSRDLLDRARAWLAKAGLAGVCRFEAGDGLAALARAEAGLDLVFLDCNKSDYPRAFALALPKVRSGGMIVADNVLWGGSVLGGESDDSTSGAREYIRLIKETEGCVSSIVPLHDGLALTLKR